MCRTLQSDLSSLSTKVNRSHSNFHRRSLANEYAYIQPLNAKNTLIKHFYETHGLNVTFLSIKLSRCTYLINLIELFITSIWFNKFKFYFYQMVCDNDCFFSHSCDKISPIFCIRNWLFMPVLFFFAFYGCAAHWKKLYRKLI